MVAPRPVLTGGAVPAVGGLGRLLLGLAALSFIADAPSFGQEDPQPAGLGGDPAVTAIRTSLSIEQTLLGEDRTGHANLAVRRKRIVARLSELKSARDRAVAREDAAVPTLIERLNVQIEQTEGERAELQASERVLVESVRGRLRRIALLNERLDALLAVERPQEGVLSGRWEVALLPGTQRGVFEIRQTGTLVSGVYRLSGGFTGSLRGTLVKTKVFLERIDSQLGKSMQFEGRLSGDRNMIRGTWSSYELADGNGSSGQWSASRKTAE